MENSVYRYFWILILLIINAISIYFHYFFYHKYYYYYINITSRSKVYFFEFLTCSCYSRQFTRPLFFKRTSTETKLHSFFALPLQSNLFTIPLTFSSVLIKLILQRCCINFNTLDFILRDGERFYLGIVPNHYFRRSV